MLFSSISFLYYFLPIFLVLYFISPKKMKNFILMIASLIFYAWGEPVFVFLMAGSILLGYISGIVIEKYKSKWLLFGPLLILFGLLGYFKYANFFVAEFENLTGISVHMKNVLLPVGISFYTFQIASYVIDVYRGDVKAQKNIISLGAYVSMFPQLIAGPIVRYADIETMLTNRTVSIEKINAGIQRFVIGLSKKVLIANVLGEFCTLVKGTNDPSVLFTWAYAVAISLQIYFDFSGYSDMAIGLGKIIGFDFMENFNYPYMSKSITEFWRRWHMSLGQWFRDYVYIPLGGNKKGLKRQIFNILVVWTLTGFWHGAAWNFMLWGLYFGVLLIFEKYGLLKVLKNHPVVGSLYTVVLVIFGFVLFDANSISSGMEVIKTMFGLNQVPLISTTSAYYLGSYFTVFVVAIIGATNIPKRLASKIPEKAKTFISMVFYLFLFILSTAYLIDGSFNPFLYFRF